MTSTMAKVEDDVRVLGSWSSPFVMRVRIALNLKSVNYEFLQETFGSKTQLLLESNPVHKKIPVLIHANKPIAESLIILQYIDEVWSSSAPPILPSDPYDRAMARFWADFVDDKVLTPMRASLGVAEEEAKRGLLSEAGEAMGLMEEGLGRLSKGKEFFGGDQIGFVDVAFGSLLGWIRVVEMSNGVKLIDGVKTPGLAGWAEKFSAHGTVKDLLPETQKLLEFAKVLAATMREGPPPQ